MELKDIQSLIKFVTKSGASEVKLEMEDVKITIRTGEHNKGETTFIQQMPQMAASAPAPAAALAIVNSFTADPVAVKRAN